MGRIDPRALVLISLLALGGCGDDDPAPVTPAPPSSVAPPSAPASAPASAGAGSAEPSPDESVYVEEDPDPTEPPGQLSQQGQSYLDEALGLELGALEGAGDQAKQRRAILDKLPEDPDKVLIALQGYPWWSPEAKTLYDKALATRN
jgi:hypothetical protein